MCSKTWVNSEVAIKGHVGNLSDTQRNLSTIPAEDKEYKYMDNIIYEYMKKNKTSNSSSVTF